MPDTSLPDKNLPETPYIRLASLMILALLLAACTAPSTATSQPAGTDQVDQVLDDFGVPMVLVPGGQADIIIHEGGTGKTTVQEIVVEDFYVDVYEVTNQRYAECVQSGECAEPLDASSFADPDNADHPVVYISWPMAQAYCEWRDARLPTKDEWDYAAHDELNQVVYFWGDESPVCQVGARYPGKFEDYHDFKVDTTSLDSNSPNMFGLYGLTGGVWEWVEDWLAEEAAIPQDSANNTVSFIRMSRWSGYGPLYTSFFCGLRCAKSP